jgi:iodothyronine deiodinase-like protein
VPALNKLYREYEGRAAFYFVYIQEAHASDAWQVSGNRKDGVIFATPLSLDQRASVAGACQRSLKIDLPILVDGLDDGVDRAYDAWPDRLYLVDREGKVAYKSRAGPFGFKVSLLGEALARALGPTGS